MKAKPKKPRNFSAPYLRADCRKDGLVRLQVDQTTYLDAMDLGLRLKHGLMTQRYVPYYFTKEDNHALNRLINWLQKTQEYRSQISIGGPNETKAKK